MRRRPKFIIAGLILILIIGVVIYLKKGQASIYTFDTVQKRNITQTVSVTGSVEADPKIKLQFQSNGQISAIHVKEGDPVKKGVILAELDNDDLAIQLKSAQALLTYNQANLEKAIAGASKEEIALAKIAVEQSKVDLENTQKAYLDLQKVDEQKIKEAEIAVDQAKVNLEKAQTDLAYTKQITAQNLKTAELSVTQAKTALDNSSTSVTNTEATSSLSLENAYEDIIPKMDSSLVTAEQNLQAIDNILGINSSSILPSSVTLGAKDSNSLVQAINSYKIAKGTYELTKTHYQIWLTTKDKTTLETQVDELTIMLEQAKTALDYTYQSLVSASTSGETGVSSNIKVFMDLITTQKTNNYTAYQNLRDAYQAIETAKLSEDSSTHTAKSTEDTAQSQYDQAVETLNTTQVNSANQVKNAELLVETRENDLAQAEQNLTQTKVTTEKQENDLNAQIQLKEIGVKNAEASLDKLIAPPREVDLKSLRANVTKAQADLEKADYTFNQTLLKAPIDGVVVDLKKEIGENITANEIFAIINSKSLLITSNVSETDIAKVKIGNKATMTFDAFDFADEFTGEVVEIAPAETIVEGVIYYQIKSSFSLKEGKEIRSGMTANLKITTASKETVLSIPLRAVKYENQKRYAQILDQGKVVDKEIQTGLEGDQYVEITGGLTEGEEIITFIKYEYQL